MSTPRRIKNIALTGFMGTGKSSVGRIVAGLLNFTFLDTDALIEARTSRTISKIFAEDGEAAFRRHESGAVRYLMVLKDHVIATGGGLGADGGNLASLKQHALVVCLWASPETIWDRIGHHSHRPLLQGPDPLGKIRELLAIREAVYKQADVLVNTEQRSLREVAQQVVTHFQAATAAAP